MLHPDDIIGPYRLIRFLGGGAFGEVWLAEEHAVRVTSEFALKFLRSDEVDAEKAEHEPKIWKRVTGHTNIVSFIKADVYDDHFVIVSEYMRDGSLQDWFKRDQGQQPSIASAVKMMMGILDGLEHLHAHRIVHRDLKPGNILLQGTTPLLADFGVSRVISSKSSSHSVGTLPYCAPETFRGRYTEQTDLWAAGVILYQLSTGRLPFPQKDQASLMEAINSRPPDPFPPTVSQSLQAIIARALEKDPTRRYKSVEEMREALGGVSQTEVDLDDNAIENLPTKPLPPNEPIQTLPDSDASTNSPHPQAAAPEAKPNKLDVPNQSAKQLDIAQPRSNSWKHAAALVALALVIGLAIFLSRNFSAPAKPNATLTPTRSLADSPTPTATQPAALQSFTEDLGNGVKLEMVQLLGGSFEMGSDDDHDNEKPKHNVKVDTFAIGKYEVTQAQWQAVVGNNPSSFKGAELPVENVSWSEAVEFCQKLTNKTGKNYRLPTEAEWEYAARAGNLDKWCFGNDEKLLSEYGWYYKNSDGKTHPVGKKKANAFGLYDMYGNVGEWVQSVYHKDYYSKDPPLMTQEGIYRGLRGGSWGEPSGACSNTFRNGTPESRTANTLGFRVAMGTQTQ